MVKEGRQAVKKEKEGDLDGPVAVLNVRQPKAKVGDGDITLAFSTGRKKKKPSNPPKEINEETEDDDDEKALKKKEVQKKISKPAKLKKETFVDSVEEEEKKAVKKNKKRKRNEEDKMVVGKIKKISASQKKDKSDKKEKKVYNLPGQKHDPPGIRHPLRIFYETLYQKVPTCEMAAFWMLERGLLPLEAAKVYQKKLLRKRHQKLDSPTKLISTKKSLTVSTKKKKTKTVVKTLKKLQVSNLKAEEE